MIAVFTPTLPLSTPEHTIKSVCHIVFQYRSHRTRQRRKMGEKVEGEQFRDSERVGEEHGMKAVSPKDLANMK